jgi:NAD(P)-dependent dehydrogenase (short-subunit alcohol dehydrogenase family)
VAFTFAEAGVKIILLADIKSEGIVKAAERSTALASNPDYHCFSSTVDVTDAASVEAMVNLAVDRFGRIDYDINAFGVRCHEREEWRQDLLESRLSPNMFPFRHKRG